MNKWLSYCIKEVNNHKTECKHKMSAVIVKGGSVLSVGLNREVSEMAGRVHNPDLPSFVGIHAEIDALRRCDADTEGASIFVAGISPAGRYLCSKPCDHCWYYIEEAGIRKIGWMDGSGEYTFTRV